jgi:signal transduction histidine kinase
MAEDTQADAGPPPHLQLSADALREWLLNTEGVMRGVAHALNNRAAALSAVVELSREPTDDDPEATHSILNSELLRVSELARAVRLLGTPRSGTEAFAPRDVVGDAIALLRLHSEQRERVISIDTASAPPIRVPRWMFVRSLVALCSAAAKASGAAHVQVTVAGDGDWVTVRVDGVSASLAALSPFTVEVARAMDGAPLDSGFGFRIPSLSAIRQREAR